MSAVLSNVQKRYLRGLAHDLKPVLLLGSKGVRASVNIATLDAAAGEHRRENLGPVITAIIIILISRSRNTSLGASTKFTHRNDQGFCEQSPFIQISDESGKA